MYRGPPYLSQGRQGARIYHDPCKIAGSGLAAEGDKIIHVQQIEPGSKVLAFGSGGGVHIIEKLARFQVGRNPLLH